MNLKRGAAFAFVAVLVFAAHSESSLQKAPLTLTIQDAVNTALENNISLKRNQIQFNAAGRTKKYSWNSVSPSLSVGAGFSKNNEHFADNHTAYIQGSINFTLSTNLYTDIKSAALKYQAGELSYESAKRTVELNVRSAFYNLLYQDQNVLLQQNALNTALQQYQTNQRKYNQGAISQLDVLTSQVNYEKLIPQVQSAQITRDNNFALFKQMLGVEQDTQIELSGNLDDVVENIKSFALEKEKLEGAQNFVESVDSKNPEVAALEKNLEIAKTSLLASRFSAYGPTISAGWSYRPTWVKSATSDTTTGPDDRGALNLSVTIPLDGLMPWSKGGLGISTAKDNIKDLELQIQNKKTDVQVATESGIRSIEQLASTVQTLQSSVTLAERTYQMTAEAYNRGTRNFTELLSARDSLEAARLNLKQQAYNLATAVLNLENTLGIPFGTLLNNDTNTTEEIQ